MGSGLFYIVSSTNRELGVMGSGLFYIVSSTNRELRRYGVRVVLYCFVHEQRVKALWGPGCFILFRPRTES